MVGDNEKNSAEDNDAINAAGDPIEGEPAGFAGGICGALGFFNAEEPAFAKVAKVLIGALGEIGNFNEVAENVVTVKAQEWIGVEEDGRNGGHEHDVVEQAVESPLPCVGPNENGDG